MHCELTHSPAPLHAVPLGFFALQLPLSHHSPEGHRTLALQVTAHTFPLHG
jgi:hypothetical protein